MNNQEKPFIKNIISTEQFNYLKEQLSNYYFSSSYYKEKIENKFRFIGSCAYLITLFSFFIVPKPYSRNLAIVVIILMILPHILSIYIQQLQKYKLSIYHDEIEEKKYLVTQGKILKVGAWHIAQKRLELQIQFQILNNQWIEKTFNIPYPSFDHPKAEFTPQKLLGQAIKLCLLPKSYLLLHIQIIPNDLHQLQFIDQPTGLWSLHQQGIPTGQTVIIQTIQKIQFIRYQSHADFFIYCHCPEHPDFEISSAIINFEEVERVLFEHFNNIDFNQYQQLKYSNFPQQVDLWQATEFLTNHLKVQRKTQIELKIFIAFIGTIILFFIMLYNIPTFLAISFLLGNIFIFTLLLLHYYMKYSPYLNKPQL